MFRKVNLLAVALAAVFLAAACHDNAGVAKGPEFDIGAVGGKCFSDNTCSGTAVCNLVTKICEAGEVECDSNDDCNIGDICSAGVCIEEGSCKGQQGCPCATTVDCQEGLECNAHLRCQVKSVEPPVDPNLGKIGYPCKADSTCTEGICKNDYCVDTKTVCLEPQQPIRYFLRDSTKDEYVWLCVADSSTIQNKIISPAIKLKILDTLNPDINHSTFEQITFKDAKAVSELDLRNEIIRDLGGLEFLVNLQRLRLPYRDAITDGKHINFSPDAMIHLSDLSNLKVISLEEYLGGLDSIKQLLTKKWSAGSELWLFNSQYLRLYDRYVAKTAAPLPSNASERDTKLYELSLERLNNMRKDLTFLKESGVCVIRVQMDSNQGKKCFGPSQNEWQ